MAERTVGLDIKSSIDQFIEVASKHYKIDAAILFGSFARGTNHEDSDIDVAVISNDIKDKFDDMAKLMTLTWGIDTRIEPHPIRTDDFIKRDTSLIIDIIETGIPITWAKKPFA